MFTNYSSRRFKVSHIKRLRTLKEAYFKLGEPKTMQQLLVDAVEIGLQILENPERDPKQPRIVPFGIKEVGDEPSNR